MKNNIMKGLLGLTLILMTASLYMIFVYVPTEASMGAVQRIFYFHVPLAWLAFLAFFIVFLGSILFLARRDAKWDRLATSSAKVGVIFTTLFLVSGSIWARPIWGVWWTWDPRLTSALILWLIYVAYLLVRSYVSDREQAARFGAVIGIAGFADVPIVALAVVLWRTEHPSPIVFEGGLAPSMLLTLLVSITAFTALYFLLLAAEFSVKNMEAEVKKLGDGFVSRLAEITPGEKEIKMAKAPGQSGKAGNTTRKENRNG